MSTKTLMSIEEFDRLEEPDDQRYELDEGELIIMSRPRLLHNRIGMRLIAHFIRYLDKNPLGEVFGADIMYVLGAATKRAPDVSFVRKDRSATLDPQKDIEGGPDLAIEILSPNDSATATRRKVMQYLAAGTHTVWVVYPEIRAVEIWTGVEDSFTMLKEDRNLSTELLPGFEIPIRDLFL